METNPYGKPPRIGNTAVSETGSTTGDGLPLRNEEDSGPQLQSVGRSAHTWDVVDSYEREDPVDLGL